MQADASEEGGGVRHQGTHRRYHGGKSQEKMETRWQQPQVKTNLKSQEASAKSYCKRAAAALQQRRHHSGIIQHEPRSGLSVARAYLRVDDQHQHRHAPEDQVLVHHLPVEHQLVCLRRPSLEADRRGHRCARTRAEQDRSRGRDGRTERRCRGRRMSVTFGRPFTSLMHALKPFNQGGAVMIGNAAANARTLRSSSFF